MPTNQNERTIINIKLIKPIIIKSAELLIYETKEDDDFVGLEYFI